MVYFQVSRIGFNCGKDRDQCNFYPDRCEDCVSSYLTQVGFDTSQNIKISMIESEQKRIEMLRSQIWYKFADLLNIKHIILMTKDSGLLMVDYPISGGGIDVDLLIGFIQANITFSTSSSAIDTRAGIMKAHKFYEFQYETFNILLKGGDYIRICLVLDQQASSNLKNLASEFLYEYERLYQSKIEYLLKTGKLNFQDTINFIIDKFNIKLVFPMVLTHTLLPNDLEQIEKNPIQKAVVDFAKKLLATKKFFFINNLLNKVQSIYQSSPHVILYEIYLLLEKKIIIPSNIETIASNVRKFEEGRAQRIAQNELISPIIANDKAMAELKSKAGSMNPDDAKKLMENYIKKGETAEKALAYKEAQKEYEKALYLATGFNFNIDIGKISFMVLELDKKIKAIEIGFAIESGEKAEKKKDYINAIQHFQKAISFLNNDGNPNGNATRIKKLEKKITSLKKHI